MQGLNSGKKNEKHFYIFTEFSIICHNSVPQPATVAMNRWLLLEAHIWVRKLSLSEYFLGITFARPLRFSNFTAILLVHCLPNDNSSFWRQEMCPNKLRTSRLAKFRTSEKAKTRFPLWFRWDYLEFRLPRQVTFFKRKFLRRVGFRLGRWFHSPDTHPGTHRRYKWVMVNCWSNLTKSWG